MKKTKIICSIGPASSNPDIMCEMVKNGMNVARINFSHATLDERKEVVSSVKKVREMTGENVAILYDTKGPEFRNRVLENDQINLVEGKTIRIVKEKVLGNEERFSVNHPNAIDSINISGFSETRPSGASYLPLDTSESFCQGTCNQVVERPSSSYTCNY